jgi:lysophospholipase L1-like esterase
MKKARNRLHIVIVNISLLAIGLLAIEIMFGYWIRDDTLLRINVLRSYIGRYRLEGLYQFHSDTVVYTRDKYGLRGNFKDPSEIDLLTVGGSTTDQRYVSDGYTWQDVIQEDFTSFGRNMVVGNAGVDGQSTYGHIKNYQWWFNHIPRFKPSYVLFYVGINDFLKDEDYSYDDITGKPKGIVGILKDKSALWNLLRVVRGVYLSRKDIGVGHRKIDFSQSKWTTIPLQNDYEIIMTRRLMAYRTRLQALIKATKDFGARPIFVTQPMRMWRLNEGIIEGISDISRYDEHQINGIDRYYMMRRQDSVTCAFAAENGLECIDLGANLSWDDADFYDYGHMTPKGAKKVGNLMFDRLRRFL